jgi:predicted metal-dependent peptidase
MKDVEINGDVLGEIKIGKRTIKLIKPKPLDVKDLIKSEKRFEWLITFLIVNFKFVHQILGAMKKIPRNGFGTMGVCIKSGGKFELTYDPAFLEALTDSEATFVLYHEVLHLALHHCTRRQFDDHKLSNIATDLAVNELIPDSQDSCSRPRMKNEKGENKVCGCFVDDIKKMKQFADILPKQTSEWYYDYLKKKQQEQGGGGGQGQPQKGQGQGQPQSGQGQNQPGEGDGDFDIELLDTHGGWKEDEIADERAKDMVEKIRQSNSWGPMPADIQEIIMAAQVRKINWRNLIRRFFGNMITTDRECTRKRPNRRTGLVHPGFKKIRQDKHLVAIDTSGSVDSDLLSQFLGVINQMTNYLAIDVTQFDAAIHCQPKAFDRKKKDYGITGRGGTDFQPVFDLAKERRYRSVILLTDGCAPAPIKPNHMRALWVLPKGCNPPVDWGLRVHLERHV